MEQWLVVCLMLSIESNERLFVDALLTGILS